MGMWLMLPSEEPSFFAPHLENISTETISGVVGSADPAPSQEFFPNLSPRQQ